jgi:predicted nucleotidyltransferase
MPGSAQGEHVRVSADKSRFEVVSRSLEFAKLDQIRQAKSESAEICRRLDLFGSALGPSSDPRTIDLDFLVEFGVFTKGE